MLDRGVQQCSCEQAALSGSKACLSYVQFVMGLPWDEATCAEAAKAGSIMALSYAHNLQCPWDVSTLLAAAGCLALLV